MHTPNGTTKNGRDPYFPYSIPTARIAPILRRWLAENYLPSTNDPKVYGLHRLEQLTGISARRLFSILREDGVTVEFNTADRILCGLGLVNLWHVQPDDGGLADWYEADEENPLPEIPKPTPFQIETRERENATRERRRLRREKQRRSAVAA